MRSTLRSVLIGAALVVALSAVGTGSASATKFKCAKYPCTVKTSFSEGELQRGAWSLGCEVSFLSGKLTTDSETLILQPTFRECTNLGLKWTTQTKGCSYYLHTNGSVDIGPASCGPIAFTILGCELKVPSQEGLKSASYKNEESHGVKTVSIGMRLEELNYQIVNKFGPACPNETPIEEMTYTQSPLAQASEEGKAIGFSVE